MTNTSFLFALRLNEILFCEASFNRCLRCFMTQKRTVLPPIRVTEEEKETIKIMADVYGLSLSKYIRIAALARTQTLKGRAEASITVKLLKINADQARLGNLLKMAMERGHGGAETMRIIKDIRAVQDDLKEAVRLI